MDIRVDSINLRCHFYDNYSERKFVFTPWRYDFQERRLLEQELPTDGVFIDIGANIGLYTLTANKVLSNRGRILAFEPNPVTLKRLDFNIRANQKSMEAQPAIALLNLGIADCDSNFELWPDKSNLGAYSIRAGGRARNNDHENSTPSTMIRCRPLLHILEEQKVERIDVLKIDIEGAEDIALGPYLEQAPDLLLANTIIIENSEAFWNCDLFSMMKNRGYRQRFRNKLNSIFSLSVWGSHGNK